ncbi:pyrroline-5-carboxylate reductase [Chitinispirillales bacterium ANBcel5]|uniref:pyrroline-5-carboxylate reductase n=1 Tax=Cellulosispirillum alkaliphilum TaxID=3039283 RepID=UPI002A536BF6|nr:pyrroline-5-carboxylate reductase [Chitinispirillales bacterium ANBcel5]
MDIAVFGCGNMGKALIGGLLKSFGDDVTIHAFDKESSALDDLDLRVHKTVPAKWQSPDVIILSVKPTDFEDALTTIRPLFDQKNFQSLIISVAAGISTSFMQNKLAKSLRICRVMPNTPALIGEGLSAYAMNPNCTEADSNLVKTIFGACGKVVEIKEELMDAITGLSGSGPAFVYSFIEALAEGGVSAGLPFTTALESAAQTVIGAAQMVLKASEHPSVLKAKVTSPGGTTIQGLFALEQGNFKHTVMNAVVKAANRSKELSR